jgi:hypothetical protein
MQRVKALLDQVGIPTGQVQSGRAEFVALDRDAYHEHIAGATQQLGLDKPEQSACVGTLPY